jgi:hypothetical protein
MRLILGIVIGVALTLGAAYYHDTHLPAQTARTELADRPLVNWSVLGALARRGRDSLTGLIGGKGK